MPPIPQDCPWCGETFKSKNKLKKHIGDDHKEEHVQAALKKPKPSSRQPPPLSLFNKRMILESEARCRRLAPFEPYFRNQLKKIAQLKSEGYTLENTKTPSVIKKPEKPITKKKPEKPTVTKVPTSGTFVPGGSSSSRVTATTSATTGPFSHKKETVQNDVFNDTSDGDNTSDGDDDRYVCDDCLNDLAHDDYSDDYGDFSDDCDDFDDYGDDF